MEVRSAAVWRFELTMHKLLLALDQLDDQASGQLLLKGYQQMAGWPKGARH